KEQDPPYDAFTLLQRAIELSTRDAAWVRRRVDVEVEAGRIVDDALQRGGRHRNVAHTEGHHAVGLRHRVGRDDARADDDTAVDASSAGMDVSSDDGRARGKAGQLEKEVGCSSRDGAC